MSALPGTSRFPRTRGDRPYPRRGVVRRCEVPPHARGINASKPQLFTDNIFIPKRTRLPSRKHESKRTKATLRRKSIRPNQKKSANAPKPASPNPNPQASTRKAKLRPNRQERKEQGLCCCGQAAIQGQTRCPTCAEKHRTWNRQNSEDRRRAKGAKPRPRISSGSIEQLRKEIAAQDKGASRTTKRVRSNTHNQKAAQHQAQVRAERKSLGLCVGCAKPSLEGQTRCSDCALKHRQSGRRDRVKAKLTAEQ